jgi:hypothetical protein
MREKTYDACTCLHCTVLQVVDDIELEPIACSATNDGPRECSAGQDSATMTTEMRTRLTNVNGKTYEREKPSGEICALTIRKSDTGPMVAALMNGARERATRVNRRPGMVDVGGETRMDHTDSYILK